MTEFHPLVVEFDLSDLVRPFSARSVVASALLGSHPPQLPAALLIALAAEFGISPGTTRVALTRMVAAGEATSDDGVYALAGKLADRQRRQDTGRRPQGPEWDGRWEQAVLTAGARSGPERAADRRDLSALGLAELRDGVWIRPSNLDPNRQPSARARLDPSVSWFHLEPLEAQAAADLTRSLFDLDRWSTIADRLVSACEAARKALGADPPDLVAGFTVAAACIRHFIHDPRLPPELQPAGWAGDRLRRSHDRLDNELSAGLRSFFASARGAPGPPS